MMIKRPSKKVLIMAGALALCLFFALLFPVFLPARQEARYAAAAQYHPESQTVTGSLQITWQNQSDKRLDAVFLQLYPNGFSNEKNAPFPKELMPSAYPSGFSDGGITLTNLTVNGQSTEGEYSHNNVVLRLPVSLGSRQTVTLEMDFTLRLPESPGRFGYGAHTANLGNWLPVMCGYDNGFVSTPYIATGDPFFSECAQYDVTFTLPAGYQMASTGKIIKKDDSNPTQTVYHISAPSARDYAAVISKDFSVASGLSGETIVYSYYFGSPEMGLKALAIAQKALEVFTKAYGPYPYGEFSVVMADFFIGGMEYPGLVYIDKTFYAAEQLGTLEHVIAHEAAHQWWYAGVGSNQISAAWLDEGLASFSTLYFYEQTRDAATLDVYYKYYAENSYRFALEEAKRLYPDLSENMERPLSEFPDWNTYAMLCYDKSSLMFKSFREQMGDGAFFAALQDFYNANLYKTAGKKELAAALNRHSRLDMEGILEAWLSGKVILSLPAA